MGDVDPPQVVDPDHSGADQEEDGDHVADPAVRDHVADFLTGVPVRVGGLVVLDVGLRRGLRLDPHEEWDEALRPTSGGDLGAGTP